MFYVFVQVQLIICYGIGICWPISLLVISVNNRVRYFRGGVSNFNQSGARK